jgi:hydrogenase maturation protease
MKSTLIICVGNPYRCDDVAGLLVADRLRAKGAGSLQIVKHDGEASRLIDVWRGFDRIFIVDAVSSREGPGTVSRLDASCAEALRAVFCVSTHSFGVADAIEMARTLGELPAEVILFGIAGESFEVGTRVSSSVIEATDKVANLIIEACTHASTQDPDR